MQSLSIFAEMYMKSSTPMISDIEVGLSLSESFSRELSKFVNSTFTTYDFSFDDNGIVKTMKLFNEDNNRYINVELFDAANITETCKKMQITEYVNDVVKYSNESYFSTFNDFKDALRTITNDYKLCQNCLKNENIENVHSDD